MDNKQIGNIIMKKRKELNFTQHELADMLNISFQAVSKWENGVSLPDILLLPKLAKILETSVDALLGYSSEVFADYEERYRSEEYYWGLKPNNLCFEIMKLMPPDRPYRVLDMGCGEGKDAVFLARNGYLVSAFDIADAGLEKAKKLADINGTHVDFFKADITDFRPEKMYDIIFCSGVFHFLFPDVRKEFVSQLKEHTNAGGLNVINVFVDKPFIERAPDYEVKKESRAEWLSGELFMLYHDWYLKQSDEVVFDCFSGGVPHQHCMDIMIAEKVV